MTADEFSVDAALKGAFDRLDRVMSGVESRRAINSETACYQIIDPATARSIENAATWAEYGPDFTAWAERMRERGGFSEADIEADPR